MAFVTERRDGELAIITMARGKANALNQEMVEELRAAVGGAVSDEAVRGIVLSSGVPRFFSAGFDVREVFTYDRPRMEAFFGGFIDLYETIYRAPKPVVAALSGHTVAGGAILAVACDLRVMAEPDAGFALNEINLGLVVTHGLLHMAKAAVGIPYLREILLSGDPVSPARALQIGLVQSLAPAEEVPRRATALARGLAAKPSAAFRETKRALQHAAGWLGVPSDREHMPEFLETWFSGEAVERKRALIEALAQETPH